jgi:hypothetical protein
VLFAATALALVVDGNGAAGSCLPNGSADSIEVADRTGHEICTTSAGATIEYIGDQNQSFGSAGTGTFHSFVRVQADGTEQGYNTDGTLEFDTKAGNFTHAILLSDIPVVTIGGTNYWELFSDINEGNNTKGISLNDVEVYFTANPDLTGYPFTGPAPNIATKVYDFSGTMKINDVNQGSGRGDLRYRIPLTNITGIPAECGYKNPACTTYFVLYNRWGTTGGAYASDGGFEEWKVKEYPTLQIVKNTVGGDNTFTFHVTGPSAPTPDPSITTSGGTGATQTYIVDPGTFKITENTPPTHWGFTGAVCSFNGGAATTYTPGSDLVLGETDHVVCTFTNTHIVNTTTTSTQVKKTADDSNVADGASVPNPTSVYDTATLSGKTSDAAGTVSYYYEKQTGATDCTAGTLISTVTVAAGVVPKSGNVNLTAAGTYEFWAVYSGDPNNLGSTSTCGAETVVVTSPGAGCTPGFWQGGVGIKLWNIVNDPDWTSHGGLGTNPFIESQTFSSFFLATGNTTVDNMTMLEIVGSGGTNVWARKAARDLIAAYLNSSFLGSAYPYSTATILADWATAVAGGTAGFQVFHAKYSAANELGCPIGNDTTVTLAAPNSGLLALASVVPIIGFGVLRRRRRR